MSDTKYKMVNITSSGSRAQLVVSNPQPYKMIRENIWQRTDPGTLWHPGVQEHGCEWGLWVPQKIDLHIPSPLKHPDTHSISGSISLTHTQNPSEYN